jgi:hypothetical protein
MRHHNWEKQYMLSKYCKGRHILGVILFDVELREI